MYSAVVQSGGNDNPLPKVLDVDEVCPFFGSANHKRVVRLPGYVGEYFVGLSRQIDIATTRLAIRQPQVIT